MSNTITCPELTRVGGQESVVCIDVPAELRYLDTLSVCIAALLGGLTDMDEAAAAIHNVQVAVREACVNIVEHAYGGIWGGRILANLALEGQPRRISVELRDFGAAFDAESIARPNPGDVRTHGYGLFLMHELLDVVIYERREDYNYWHLVKRI